MGFLSDIWDGIGPAIGSVVGLATGQPLAGAATNFLGSELWGEDGPIENTELPAVDDWSNWNSPPGQGGFADLSFPGNLPAPAFSASNVTDLIKSVTSPLGDITRALSPLVPLATGAFGYSGQEKVNELNRELANSAMAFSAAQAKEAFDRSSSFNASQADIARSFNAAEAGKMRDFGAAQAKAAMDFSERMSGTQWQRTVDDLKAAGLNPMLAYMRGPNSAPGGVAGAGASASGPAASASSGAASGIVPQVGNSMAAMISSAQSGSMVSAQVSELAARAALEDAKAVVAREEARKVVQEVANLQVTMGKTHMESRYIGELYDKVSFEIRNLVADTALKTQNVDKVVQEIVGIVSHTNLWDKEAALAAQHRVESVIRTKLLQLEIPRATNEAAVQSSWWKREFSPYLPDVLKSVGSAAGAARILGR